jgi:hypothetical protein
MLHEAVVAMDNPLGAGLKMMFNQPQQRRS